MILSSSSIQITKAGSVVNIDFHQHWLGCTKSMGSPPLRTEICNLYSDIQPDDVLVHTGAEEAIFLFMHAVLKRNL